MHYKNIIYGRIDNKGITILLLSYGTSWSIFKINLQFLIQKYSNNNTLSYGNLESNLFRIDPQIIDYTSQYQTLKLLISQSGSEILLTDFKYACRFRKQQKNIIVNNNLRSSSNKQFLNIFSSLNQHLEQVSSPKDDLESLALIIIYYAGFASVLDIKEENRGLKIKKLEHIKLTLLPKLSFKGAPYVFIQFYNGVKQSSVSDYPQDYEKYKQIFRKILNICGYSEKDIVYPHLQMMKQYHYNYNFNVIIEEQETQAQMDSIDEEQSVLRKIKQLDGKRYHRLISLENQKQNSQKELLELIINLFYIIQIFFTVYKDNLNNIASRKKKFTILLFYVDLKKNQFNYQVFNNLKILTNMIDIDQFQKFSQNFLIKILFLF
ncbi:unnamed protein product [Paramecium sonneborni]|uniref:Uncharacterized protein n=1 Tax=Paramecium sonneborni TaxID=65129 RepID=A0A8S1P7R4_9CILI|nr:unnamed protein product [Paramecium sonneborni]